MGKMGTKQPSEAENTQHNTHAPQAGKVLIKPLEELFLTKSQRFEPRCSAWDAMLTSEPGLRQACGYGPLRPSSPGQLLPNLQSLAQAPGHSGMCARQQEAWPPSLI